jgi:hypothetical protein
MALILSNVIAFFLSLILYGNKNKIALNDALGTRDIECIKNSL